MCPASDAKDAAEGRTSGPKAAIGAELLAVLKELGMMGATEGFVPLRSAELGRRLGRSQQTASNRLLALANGGLLVRQMGSRGQRVRLTDRGREVLRREYGDYELIFRRPSTLAIRGTVRTGLGEGRYYIDQPGYRNQFKKLLGFSPRYGTLNLFLEREEAERFSRLGALGGLLLEEFEKDGRTFGGVRCFPCRIKDARAAVILPLRTHHRDVMELIAHENLRQRFGLSDGDEVEVLVETG